MMSIDELYGKIFASLQSIRQKDVEEKNKTQENAKNQKLQVEQNIKVLEERIDDILPFQSAATAFVSTSMAQRVFTPHQIDISRLDQLYYQATTSTGNSSTSSWERLYEAAASGIAYHRQAINALKAKGTPAASSLSSHRLDEACKSVLLGSEVKQLRQAFQIVDQTYTPRILSNKSFEKPQKETSALFGRSTKPFPVTDGCIGLAKQLFGGAFSENDQTLLMPCSLPNVTLFQIGSNAVELVMGAIRAYIIAFLSYSIPSQQKINYIDTCALDSSCLGILQPLLNSNGEIIMPVPTSQEGCNRRLVALRQTISSESTHGRRLLVYRFRQSTHNSQSDTQIQWLCANAANYNIQVIAVQETARYEKDFDRMIPDWFPSNSLIIRVGSSKCLESSKSHSRIATYPEPSEISQHFLNNIIKAYAPAPLQTRYFDVRQMHMTPTNLQRMRKKPISLLYGVGERGEKYSLDLAGADFSAYLLGAARSGKSNLLNILITSAIMDYHPDDLELWLVDFGRTEFSRYIRHTPPHVRYVLVEKTTELVCSLVDKLIDEMKRRGEILSQYNALKMQELPESVQMPTLLVIIDEFGVFKEILSSDEFDEKKKYKAYMERLLKQGAKHGMCFIFANQSFTDVYSALPEEGSDQIGLRMAMLAKTSEMKAVLEAKGSLLTESEETRINKLPKYQVLFRSRENGGNLTGPVHVLYFTEDDKIQQERIIDEMNKSLSPTAKSRTDSVNTYFAHPQLCLDHNAIPTFKDRLSNICHDIETWQKNVASQDTDLLLYLGEPRNMEPVHHELLRSEKKENLLLYGDYKNSLERIAEVVAGAVKSASLQKWPVEFWCDEKDTLTRMFINKWKTGTVIKGKRQLVARVKELDQQLKDNTMSKRLIVISGLSSSVLSIQNEIEEQAVLGSNKTISANQLQRIRELMSNGGVAEDYGDTSFTELEDIVPYLNSLLVFSPRHNVHFLVVIQKEGELTDANLSIDHFTHYAAFASGLSDTQYFQLKRRVDRISEEEMVGCLTGNGYFTVYTPFSL